MFLRLRLGGEILKKIAIMTDSNSGITQSQGKELGIFIIPMPFMINEQPYLEDISLNQIQFYDFLKNDAEVCTSQPSPEVVMDLFDSILKEYDEIVHIPMSSGLSGSFQTAYMLSQEEEYDGKVYVVNNQRISVTQRQAVMDAILLVQKGYDGKQILEILEEDKFQSSIYIMLDTLYYLKKGGRITPAAAALGTLLKLKPVLQIQGEKLDAYAKARTSNQGKNLMIQAVKNDIENRFGGLDEGSKDRVTLHIAYSYDEIESQKWLEEVQEAFPGYVIKIDPLSLSIACHIGPGALALACTKNLEK